MKTIIFMMALFIPFFSYSNDSYSLALKNEKILIVLDMKCNPCDIECNNIHYRLFDLKKGVQTSGKAESVNAGVNRNFIGYRLLATNKLSYMLIPNAINESWEIDTESNFNLISKDSVDTVFGDGTC